MNAVPPFLSVTLMLTVRILADLMFVPAKLDLLEMGKIAKVREFSHVSSFGTKSSHRSSLPKFVNANWRAGCVTKLLAG